MRMAFSNTGGNISSTGYVLGVFLVKAFYTVRGRRPEELPVEAEILMWN
jgi:transcriptional/translational regulatory protein YebC/TACO1